MKLKITVLIFLALLITPNHFAQQSTSSPTTQPEPKLPEPRIVSLSDEAQIPIQQLLEEQRLLSAKLEGALLAIKAILGLAPECRPVLDANGKLQFSCPPIVKPVEKSKK